MNKTKRGLVKILISVTVVFCIYNVFWFTWMQVRYASYSAAVPINKLGVRILKDKEGFNYGVKRPGYLSFTGNLSVVMPSVNDEIGFNDALIIWPKAFGGYQYGIILYESTSTNESLQYQIYIDEQGNAIESDKEIDLIVQKHRSSIDTLLYKANEMWDLGN